MLYFKKIDQGHKEWVVCLHAVCTGHFIFQDQVDALLQDFNVLLIDLPGHFQSSHIPADPTRPYEHAADEVIGVLDHLEIRQAHFVGISLGTVVIHQLMKNHAHRFRRVVLGGAVTRFTKRAKRVKRMAFSFLPVAPYRFMFRRLMVYMMPNENHAPSNHIIEKYGSSMGRVNFLSWMKAINRMEHVFIAYPLGEPTVPRLFLSGDEDHTIVPALKEDLERENIKLEYIRGCGHMCNMERPKEFNQKMMEFLRNEAS
ncbi:alpha/beta hydrolase (plasmid) [Pontibacillus sp. ALD_SL1]|uniref:alpha/beta fold hydrolase n=1 Tax=Pontibacillus sp. ALD_SL1 TaxID=2777185 RepID=UPI001A95B7B8|nr:alpha/beta hydrolase [Pontibacillus sp. ALD_SL1]QST02640.1 alpha/beta hydrolase [Pontibacillus sp. ALD_SL1]